MRRLHLDLAPPSWQRVVWLTPGWVWAAAVAGLLLGAGSAWQLWQQQGERAILAQALLQVSQPHPSPAMAGRGLAERATVSRQEAQVINRAIGQLNLPWEGLLEAFESAADPQVALLELHPQAALRQMIGVAEARHSDDMVRYIERLKAQPLFAMAVLKAHEVNEQDPNRPVRFEFMAAWREFQP